MVVMLLVEAASTKPETWVGQSKRTKRVALWSAVRGTECVDDVVDRRSRSPYNSRREFDSSVGCSLLPECAACQDLVISGDFFSVTANSIDVAVQSLTALNSLHVMLSKLGFLGG